MYKVICVARFRDMSDISVQSITYVQYIQQRLKYLLN